jgi:hypothetical protein
MVVRRVFQKAANKRKIRRRWPADNRDPETPTW